MDDDGIFFDIYYEVIQPAVLFHTDSDHFHFLIVNALGSSSPQKHLGIGILIDFVPGRYGFHEVAFIALGEIVFWVAFCGCALVQIVDFTFSVCVRYRHS
jgi:hypothetical protein